MLISIMLIRSGRSQGCLNCIRLGNRILQYDVTRLDLLWTPFDKVVISKTSNHIWF